MLYKYRGIFMVFERHRKQRNMREFGILTGLQIEKRKEKEIQEEEKKEIQGNELREEKDRKMWELFEYFGTQSDNVRKQFPKRIFCFNEDSRLCQLVNYVLYETVKWKKPSDSKDLREVFLEYKNSRYVDDLIMEDENPDGDQLYWNHLFNEQNKFTGKLAPRYKEAAYFNEVFKEDNDLREELKDGRNTKL
eukprot:Gregarina_sp_Poly_1__10755@NODE_821_length_6140_cov_16_345299_g594_i0_p2_GENE_NODE_821_length_6140_cov_16_345299_g594_i0NODE_821_length_6140_cov_16_345299_g594_i0_p2_ORF_typecomplete_len192_score30_02DUF1985/PF09331_11/0_017DUF1985/PF09331_11/2_8e03DUF4816/PF16086_5/0_07DUF4816/PF16086_5/1_8e04_NODE_821_length_6140_cov_16_345299_g594_i034994074